MKLLNTIIGLLIIPASLFAANVNITIKGIGEVGQGTPSKKTLKPKFLFHLMIVILNHFLYI